ITNEDDIETTVSEGDDFATLKLGDSWDMNQRRDIQWEEGFTGVSTNNGLWQGSFSTTGGYLFPLFQGFDISLNWSHLGANDVYAIDTSRYTQLSMRLYTTNRSAYAIYWTYQKPVMWPLGDYFVAYQDGYRAPSGAFSTWPDGWHIYNIDLREDGDARAGVWQANSPVRGLRIDPNLLGPAGTPVKIDWIRLTDPTKSPIIPIRWQTDAGANHFVAVYVNTDDDDYEGSPLAWDIPATRGYYDLSTSVLAPGEWWVYLVLYDQPGLLQPLAHSEYAGPVTINGAPHLTITAPSRTSGVDYATEELGNPWDMSDWADLAYLYHVQSPLLADGIFSGTSAPPSGSAQQSDAHFWLHIDPAHPIDTTRYRYLTLRAAVDVPTNPAYQTISWLVENGRVTRSSWWNGDLRTDGSVTKSGFQYEGWNTYTIDLHHAAPNPSRDTPDNVLDPVDAYCAQAGWRELGQLYHLRIDPVETTWPAVGTGADRFHFDWIKLTADAESDLAYTIRWEVDDPENDDLNIQVFVTTTPPTGGMPPLDERSLIATIPAKPTAQPDQSRSNGDYQVYLPVVLNRYVPPCEGNCFTWYTYATPAGTYYIYIQAKDEYNNSTIWYAESPIVVKH
ncbi:MAG: hypothetical protein KJ734_14285, partial [Chloroflexi bacterium]|nr:hypothetical protein [Chloroflexota bacterium]